MSMPVKEKYSLNKRHTTPGHFTRKEVGIVLIGSQDINGFILRYASLSLLSALFTIMMILPSSFLLCCAEAGDTRAVRTDFYMVKMRDGISLATDVHYLDPEVERGTILVRTPYNMSKQWKYEGWANDGWNAVAQDIRGRYASEGVSTFPVMWESAEDGYDTVQWIVNQSFSNGKVATYGGSALGVVQYCMAGVNPPNLTSQYIRMAPSDQYSISAYQGGQFKRGTMGALMASQSQAFQQSIYDNENFTQGFWGNVSLNDKWSSVNVPAIHIGGWWDAFSEGIIEGFVGYHYKGGVGARGNSKLIMGPWTHGDITSRNTFGAITFPDNSKAYFAEDMFRDMLEKFMNGTSGGAYDNWPNVTYYLMGDADDPKAPGMEWKYSDVWPIPNNQTELYFYEDGSLDARPPLIEESSTSYFYDPKDPVRTKGGQNMAYSPGPQDQRSIENREDVLLFDSPVLGSPVEVTGKIRARIHVSSDRIDTDFTVKITDVYPDGRSMLVTDGILRMRNRNGTDHWEFMEPGKTYEVEVDMWSTSYVWNTGHKIRVAVSSSNYPRFLANPNTGEGINPNPTHTLIANNTLFMDRTRASAIILPIIGNYPNKVPIMIHQPVERHLSMEDQESIELSVIVTDEDLPNLTYEWYVDGERMISETGPKMIYKADAEGNAQHVIRINVVDSGLPQMNVSWYWNLRIDDIDVDLKITDSDPESPIVVDEKEVGLINFSVSIDEEDPYPNQFLWTVNGVGVANGSNYYLFGYDHGSAGEYTIRVNVSDSFGWMTHEWELTINNVNRPPLIISVNPSYPEMSIEEEIQGMITFSVDARDPDGDDLSYEWTLNDVSVGTGPLFEFAYDMNSSEVYSLKVMVSDGDREVERSWSIVVIDVNRPPSLISIYPDQADLITNEMDEGSVEFHVEYEDPDNDTLTATWWLDGKVVGEGGTDYVFHFDQNSSGTYEILVTVTDGRLNRTYAWNLRVMDVNREPFLLSYTPLDDVEVNWSDVVVFSLEVYDPDPEDTLTYTWYRNGTSIRTGHDLSFWRINTTHVEPGTYSIRAVADDGKGLSVERIWTLIVVPPEKNKKTDDDVVDDDIPPPKQDNDDDRIYLAIVPILMVLIVILAIWYLVKSRKKARKMKADGTAVQPSDEGKPDEVALEEEALGGEESIFRSDLELKVQ